MTDEQAKKLSEENRNLFEDALKEMGFEMITKTEFETFKNLFLNSLDDNEDNEDEWFGTDRWIAGVMFEKAEKCLFGEKK